MGDLDDYLITNYDGSSGNNSYPTLRFYDATTSTGEDVYDEDNNLVVDFLQPEERFNVTLYYENVTYCIYW